MRGTWQTTDSGVGGGLVVVVVLAVLFIGSGAAAVIATAVLAVLIAVAAIVVLAIAAGVGFLVWQARRESRAVTYRAEVLAPKGPSAAPAIEPGDPAPWAIEAPTPQVVNNFFGVTPEEVAEILRRQQAGQ